MNEVFIMREIIGDAWKLLASGEYSALCITTNGCIRNNGAAVMGRGIALTAVQHNPGLDIKLGRLIKTNGNVFQYMGNHLFAFPTKHDWRDNSDISLIIASAKALAARATAHPNAKYLLPRPGCANGHLSWADVKPQIQEILPENVYIITL